MYELFICVLLIISCGGMGMIKAQSYTRRLKELNDLRSMIHILNTDIMYRKDPLKQIFIRIASGRENISARLLDRCVQNMDYYSSFDDCWSAAVTEICGTSCLTDDDISILLDFKSQMGKSSVQGQNNMFRIMEERMVQQISEADQERKSKGKMYSGLGFSIGIFIAVLMI